MTSDALILRALELLTRGHHLYAGIHLDHGVADAPHRLVRHADRLVKVTALNGMRSALLPTLNLAAVLRSGAAADTTLATVLAAAHTDHGVGHHATRTVLDDAFAETLAAADTPLGRREVLRRMVARLRAQRRHIYRSRQLSQLLARRIRRLGYLPPGHAAQLRHRSAARATPLSIPLGAVRYEKLFTSRHVSADISAALDHLGVTDPVARRNWLRGYQTLIARESGGQPSAVGAEPATAPGPTQPDGIGLGYARGITQTIPATFARYHQPGTSTDIYDPVANICASMNYVMHRYGVSPDGANLIGLVQQADMLRPPKGY